MTGTGFAVIAALGVLPGVEAAQQPASVSGYAVNRLADGSPAAWRPCRTIVWAVDLRAAPQQGLADVHRAVALAEQATGLRFSYAGAVAAVPQRAWLQPGGWPPGLPDLVLAWARPAGSVGPESDLLGGDGEAGVAGWAAEDEGTGRAWIERAVVVLDPGRDGQFEPGPRPGRVGLLRAGRPPRVRLLLHELGHALGLDHVDDTGQVMHPTIKATGSSWGPGDLRGLRPPAQARRCPHPPAGQES